MMMPNASHPMWVRGLKRERRSVVKEDVQSHPMWVRGLKQQEYAQQNAHNVAPYVGAWIETYCNTRGYMLG